MNKYDIIKKIENFAPLETQEKWDCSGFAVETERIDIQKIMLCLTVTADVVCQARKQNCDMIISHHPVFCVPLEWKNIDIYSAHTNLDKAKGGTTDTLIESIFPRPLRSAKPVFLPDNFQQISPRPLRDTKGAVEHCETCDPVCLALKEQLHEHSEVANAGEGFIRYIEFKCEIIDFIEKLKSISPHLRYVNNRGVRTLHKIAFCAGSGSEFINEAYENGADAYVTGDLKFHTALESPIVVFDIGHFESEILVLPVLEKIIGTNVEIVYSVEHSPFINLDNEI